MLLKILKILYLAFFVFLFYKILSFDKKIDNFNNLINENLRYKIIFEKQNKILSEAIDSVLYYHESDSIYVRLYEIRYERGLFNSTLPVLK
jgi:hypothetical protein